MSKVRKPKTIRRFVKPNRNFDDPKYKIWRKRVYSRDKYKCRWPGCKYKSRLNAHHIRRWSAFPTLRFNVDNGVTLCKRHHDMIRGNEDNYIILFLKILQNYV